MEKISFVLTLYNPKIFQIEYWNEIYDEIISLGHEFIVLIDNPNFKLDKKYFKNVTVLENEENMGKFQTILKNLDFYTGKFIKTLDPDDFISINKLREMNNLKLEQKIYLLDSYRIKKSKIPSNQSEVENLINRSKKYIGQNFGTSWTILPIDGFKNKDIFPNKNIRINEDQILGQICLANKMRVEKIDYGFYLYVKENGVSSKENIDKYLDELLLTIDQYKKIRNNHEYENNTNWPNFNYYRILIKRSSFIFSKKRKNLKEKLNIAKYHFNQNEKNVLNNHKEQNVVYITDYNQSIYSLTNALMIHKQTKNKKMKIFIIFYSLNEFQKNEVNEIIKKNNMIFVNPVFVKENEYNLFSSKLKHVTNTTNLRLYIHKILPNIKNVLYLDNDTVVLGDISETFSFFNENKTYGRAWNPNDWWVRHHPRLNKRNHKYFNAGVLFLPLNKLREIKFENLVSKFHKRYANFIKFADQDILNGILDIDDMPYNFNIGRDSWPKLYEWLEYDKKVNIFHFLSTDKQWNINSAANKGKGSLTEKEKEKMLDAKNEWNKYFKIIKK